MSGNTTMLAVVIGTGDRHRASAIAGVISAFFGGTVFSGVLGVASGGASRTVVSAAVAFVLAVPLVVPPAEVTALAFAMGAVNAGRKLSHRWCGSPVEN